MAFGNRLIMGIVIACSLGILSNCAFPVRPGYDRKSGTYKRYRVAKKAPAKVDTTAVNPQEELVLEEKLAAASKTGSVKVTDTDSISVTDVKKTNVKDSTSQVSKKQTAVAASDSTGNKEQKSSGEQAPKQDSTKATGKIADSTTTKQTAKKADSKVDATPKPKKETKPAARPTNLEKYAREWLGAKYVYGAASKKKTDCSGYVMQVYKGFYGISLDHNAQRIYDDGRGYSIKRSKLQEGDLVFFGNFWKISHVGIYLKGNRFIHASTSDGVVITSMDDKYWSSKYKGARRFK